MLNSKQRAYLRGLANKIDPIFQIGKSGVSPELVDAIDEALESRELVKCNILNNCMEDIKYIASAISERKKSDVVQVIGKKIVIYRPSKEKQAIVLPK